MIVSTPPFLPSVMFRQNGCSRAGSTSLRVLWCPWQCPNVARRRWYLSNSTYHCNHVLEANSLLRDIRRLSGNHFIFQQDGAPAHRSRQTVAFLNMKVPEFIEPNNWPPNSPDLNPVDYSIWGALQQLVYRQKIRDLDHLKEVLTSCWEQISQDLIDKAIDQWLRRISLVIRARGGHIEHRLD